MAKEYSITIRLIRYVDENGDEISELYDSEGKWYCTVFRDCELDMISHYIENSAGEQEAAR